jgi:hypothetical protein
MRNDERRRAPRVEVLGRVQGHVVTLGLPVIVREISLGGMSLETPFSFPVGGLQHFVLTLGDGSTLSLAGRVAHCRSISGTEDPRAFITGIQFEDDAPEEPAPVADLLERLK